MESVSLSITTYDSRRSSLRHRPTLTVTAPVIPSVFPTISKLRSTGRWQYKSSLKPKVYIRKGSELLSVRSLSSSTISTTSNKITLSAITSKFVESTAHSPTAKLNLADDESSSSILYSVETLNIDIIAPSNSTDVYYEIATVKTPYTFQIGTVKKTRYVTITSTTEKSLETDIIDKTSIKGPLIENILTTPTQINQLLKGSSITTFPACTLGDVSTETPSLDNYSETFTQSHLRLKTQVFPIVNPDKSISYLTFLQTYAITTIINLTKTTPVCVGNNNLYEFNSKLDESGSEIHLDLEFADFRNYGEQDEGHSSLAVVGSSVRVPVFSEEFANKLINVESSKSISSQLSPEQLQQLAYLKLIQQNAKVPLIATIPGNALTESLYKSHIIPIIQNDQTSYRTISKLVLKTMEPSPQPFASLNPFALQHESEFKLVTSETFLKTVLTQTLSRILKLTFGAKTALTTIFSTNIISTDIATFITTSLPVAPTVSFGNVFPPAFSQFQFIG